MLLRTAKSCRLDTPTLVSSSRSRVGPTGLRQDISADDGGKQARSPGRARRKPLKPLRAGTSGDSGVLVVTRVRSTNTKCTRGRGCNGHPAFPRPLWARDSRNASGASRREAVNVCLDVIASAAKQSILSLRGTMDCFASLAMTVSEFPCTRGGVTPSLWLKMERAMRTHHTYPHRTHPSRVQPALRRHQLDAAVERAAGLGGVGADRREQADTGGAQSRTLRWQLLDPRHSAR